MSFKRENKPALRRTEMRIIRWIHQQTRTSSTALVL